MSIIEFLGFFSFFFFESETSLKNLEFEGSSQHAIQNEIIVRDDQQSFKQTVTTSDYCLSLSFALLNNKYSIIYLIRYIEGLIIARNALSAPRFSVSLPDFCRHKFTFTWTIICRYLTLPMLHMYCAWRVLQDHEMMSQ